MKPGNLHCFEDKKVYKNQWKVHKEDSDAFIEKWKCYCKKEGQKKIVTKEMLDYVQLAFEKTPQLTFK